VKSENKKWRRKDNEKDGRILCEAYSIKAIPK